MTIKNVLDENNKIRGCNEILQPLYWYARHELILMGASP